jgi:hypothetical protein
MFTLTLTPLAAGDRDANLAESLIFDNPLVTFADGTIARSLTRCASERQTPVHSCPERTAIIRACAAGRCRTRDDDGQPQ